MKKGRSRILALLALSVLLGDFSFAQDFGDQAALYELRQQEELQVQQTQYSDRLWNNYLVDAGFVNTAEPLLKKIRDYALALCPTVYPILKGRSGRLSCRDLRISDVKISAFVKGRLNPYTSNSGIRFNIEIPADILVAGDGRSVRDGAFFILNSFFQEETQYFDLSTDFLKKFLDSRNREKGAHLPWSIREENGRIMMRVRIHSYSQGIGKSFFASACDFEQKEITERVEKLFHRLPLCHEIDLGNFSEILTTWKNRNADTKNTNKKVFYGAVDATVFIALAYFSRGKSVTSTAGLILTDFVITGLNHLLMNYFHVEDILNGELNLQDKRINELGGEFESLKKAMNGKQHSEAIQKIYRAIVEYSHTIINFDEAAIIQKVFNDSKATRFTVDAELSRFLGEPAERIGCPMAQIKILTRGIRGSTVHYEAEVCGQKKKYSMNGEF